VTVPLTVTVQTGVARAGAANTQASAAAHARTAARRRDGARGRGDGVVGALVMVLFREGGAAGADGGLPVDKHSQRTASRFV
jgi:hypothetical protein